MFICFCLGVSKHLSTCPVEYYPGFHSNGLQLIDKQCHTASKVLIDNGFQVKRDGSSGGLEWEWKDKSIYTRVCVRAHARLCACDLFNHRQSMLLTLGCVLAHMHTVSLRIHCDCRLIWFAKCWWGNGSCICNDMSANMKVRQRDLYLVCDNKPLVSTKAIIKNVSCQSVSD